jgi:hypothetical protein
MDPITAAIGQIFVYLILAMVAAVVLMALAAYVLWVVHACRLVHRDVVRLAKKIPNPYEGRGFWGGEGLFWELAEMFYIKRPQWKWPKIKFDINVQKVSRDPA